RSYTHSLSLHDALPIFARLPVEAQPTVLNPSSTALLSATETTRSLNDSVGKLTASFLTHRFLTPNSRARLWHLTSGVPPTSGPRSEEHTSELQSPYDLV